MYPILTAAAITLLIAAEASAQTWRPPPDGERCPSKWGAALKIQGGTGSTVAPIAIR